MAVVASAGALVVIADTDHETTVAAASDPNPRSADPKSSGNAEQAEPTSTTGPASNDGSVPVTDPPSSITTTTATTRPPSEGSGPSAGTGPTPPPTTPSTTPAAPSPTTPPLATIPPMPAIPSRARVDVPGIAFFGDSTAMMASFGVNAWMDETGRGRYVEGLTVLGCGIGRGGERRSGPYGGTVPASCDAWPTNWSNLVGAGDPDVVVVLSGPWDLYTRKLLGDSEWRGLGDPVLDASLRADMVRAVDVLTARGALVVWLTTPPMLPPGEVDPVGNPMTDPARHARFNQLIGELPLHRPGRVAVVDLGGWLMGSGHDPVFRPDGVHLTSEHTPIVGRDFLGPAIRAAYDRWAAGR